MVQKVALILLWKLDRSQAEALKKRLETNSYSVIISESGDDDECFNNPIDLIVSGITQIQRFNREVRAQNWHWKENDAGQITVIKAPTLIDDQKINIQDCVLAKGDLIPSNGVTAHPTISRSKGQEPNSATLKATDQERLVACNIGDDLSSGNSGAALKSEDVLNGRTSWKKKYACQKKAPLKCANEDFVEILRIIKHARELQANFVGVRAYSTAISAFKSYPEKIIEEKQLQNLPGCGGKVQALWKEYNSTGAVKELAEIKNDPVLQKMELFYSIWGVGPSNARKWVMENNWSNLEDAIKHSDYLPKLVKYGLQYHHDYEKKMDRDEVLRIAEELTNAIKAIMEEYGTDDPENFCTCIVGGFRRGKPYSSDCDIVVTHTTLHDKKNFLMPLLKRIHESSLLNVALSIQTSKHEGSADGPVTVALLDILSPKVPNCHRRLDLIVSPPKYFGTCVLGWSGSITFERDLRRYAKEKFNWKFDSVGIIDLSTNREIQQDYGWKPGESATQCEKRLFRIFELPYVEPIFRNHD